MRIFYINNGQNPNIIAAVYDRDLFSWQNTIQVPHSTFDISELDPTNQGICREFANHYGKRDAAGQCKYYFNTNGTPQQKPNWTESVE